MSIHSDWHIKWEVLLLISMVEFVSDKALKYITADDFYFVTCVIFNLITLVILAIMQKNRLVRDVAVLTFIQMLIQIGGWVAYSFYMPPRAYNLCIHGIVFITYIRIFLPIKYDGLHKNTRSNRLVHRSHRLG
jgi:hypothetical protein